MRATKWRLTKEARIAHELWILIPACRLVMLAALLFVGWIRVSPPSRLIGAVCNQCDRRTGSVAGDIESRVRGEIESLHHFFVGWFGGELPAETLDADFLNRDPQCEGSPLVRSELFGQLRRVAVRRIGFPVSLASHS
jgi:hypothetical protein